MERLTKKENGWVYVRNLEDKNVSPTRVAIRKLAEFEDFMEANKFNNIKELQDALNGKFQGFFDEKHKLWKQLVAKYTKCEKENQALKDRWQKLKEWVEDDDDVVGFSHEYANQSSDTVIKQYDILTKMQELEKE